MKKKQSKLKNKRKKGRRKALESSKRVLAKHGWGWKSRQDVVRERRKHNKIT